MSVLILFRYSNPFDCLCCTLFVKELFRSVVYSYIVSLFICKILFNKFVKKNARVL